MGDGATVGVSDEGSAVGATARDGGAKGLAGGAVGRAAVGATTVAMGGTGVVEDPVPFGAVTLPTTAACRGPHAPNIMTPTRSHHAHRFKSPPPSGLDQPVRQLDQARDIPGLFAPQRILSP